MGKERGGGIARVPLFLGLALCVAAASWAETAPSAPSPPAETPSPVDTVSPALAKARAALTPFVAAKDFQARLETGLQGLEARDAALLLDGFAPLVAAETGSRIYAEAGDLWILLGGFPAAARDYEAAAGSEPGSQNEGFLLRSARAWLAAGETEKAGRLAALLLASSREPVLLDSARLVAAWVAFFGGSPASARALASVIVKEAPPAQAETGGSTSAPELQALQREARFLLWAAADGAEKATAAKALAEGFPASPEALIVVNSPLVSLSALPHWYLGLGAPFSANPGQGSGLPGAAIPAQNAPSPPDAAQPSSPSASPRFQLGIFAQVENADSLVAELKKKGFAAHVEKRKVSGKDLMAVVVDGPKAGGAGGQGLGERLKNAGYEAWPLFD